MGERWRAAVLALVVVASLGSSPAGPSKAAEGPPPRSSEVMGEWGPPIELGVHAVHAVVLRTGKVLLYGPPTDDTVGSQAAVWDPETRRSVDVSLDYRRDIFCGASSVLPDGRVFVTGGTTYGAQAEIGTRRTDFFDPTTLRWTKGPRMDFKRWYPSNVELADGRILIFSGQPEDNLIVEQIEVYDPESNEMATLPSSANRYLDLYPRIHLLPGGKLYVSGRMRRTQIFDPVTYRWNGVSAMYFGDRYSGNSVLLPGLKEIFTVGGSNQETGGRTTSSAELIDLAAPAASWRPTQSMAYPRRNANTVQLPDGRVLVVGGGQSDFGEPVRQSEIFDPDTESWSLAATQRVPRAYHSVAVLLPDGRVLSAGRHHGRNLTTGEIYSPAYLFRGARPFIYTVPGDVSYGESFTISTSQASSISKVVLVRPGSVTHSTDFDQRYVELTFEPGDQITAMAPPDGSHAPPGYYMLFVVNDDGVPSEAAWVQLT